MQINQQLPCVEPNSLNAGPLDVSFMCSLVYACKLNVTYKIHVKVINVIKNMREVQGLQVQNLVFMYAFPIFIQFKIKIILIKYLKKITWE